MSDREPEEPVPSPGTTAEDYRTLLERIPAAVFIADWHSDGKWHYVSPWIEPILGFTVEEWLTDETLWMKHLHPDDRDKTLALEREMEVSLVDEPRSVVTEYRMLHKDGRVVWIRDDAVLFPGRHGHPLWYGVLSDITAAKQVELEATHQATVAGAMEDLLRRALKGMSVSELLDSACHVAADVLDVEVTAVSEFNRSHELLEMTAVHGWDRSELGTMHSNYSSETPGRLTLATGEPVQVVDWFTETRFERSPTMTRHNIRSCAFLRIEGDESPFGIFAVMSTEPRTYTDSDIAFIRMMTTVLSDAIARQRAEDENAHRAMHDALTGLPNRVLFQDRVEQAVERLQRHHTLAAVLFIDVDNFKHINDTLRHAAGDDLLVGVAARLRDAVRPTDTVARWGGDEFGLLLDEITTERDAIATAQRIAASFAREPFLIGTSSVFVTLSIGIALTDGHEQPEELINNADGAMYLAKERGGAGYEMFDEDVRARDTARLRQKRDLELALENGQLTLAYQPIVELGDRSISGAEVLVRWNHPERGPIEAAEFIPVAEESGLIHRIGQWMLEEACRDAARWAQARPDARPIRLHVNASAAQIGNARSPDVVAAALKASRLTADQLSIEISERAMLDESETGRRTLQRLRAAGVEIVIDNFGTGHASPSQLSSMSAGAVKLDLQFAADLKAYGASGRTARAAIAMATALGLHVIAAGIESEEQVRELLSLGCRSAQGNLFSPPVTASAFAAMLLNGAHLPGTTD